MVGEFSSPEITFCADSYSVSVPPHVTTVACKRPQSFCQKCRQQVTPKDAYILDPTKVAWADYVFQAWCGNLSGKLSSHTTCGETLGHSHLSMMSHCELILALKSGIGVCQLICTLKKVQAVNEMSNLPPNSRKRGESHQHNPDMILFLTLCAE